MHLVVSVHQLRNSYLRACESFVFWGSPRLLATGGRAATRGRDLRRRRTSGGCAAPVASSRGDSEEGSTDSEDKKFTGSQITRTSAQNSRNAYYSPLRVSNTAPA